MADTLVVERTKKELFIPTEIILHCLEYVPTADLCTLLENDATGFRDVPAMVLRNRFLRLMEEPGVSLSFECGLPANFSPTVRQDLLFSHIDDSGKNLSAHFSFPHGGSPFTFSLDPNEVFQNVMFSVLLKSVLPSTTRANYTVSIFDGIHRFFKSSFSPISRLEKHSLADFPSPPCALHALHLPPQTHPVAARPGLGHSYSFGSSSSFGLSSSYPSYFSPPDQVTKYSVQYTTIELSISQLLLISEQNQAHNCTVFIFGR